jgi:hypothetical protein
MKQFLWVLLLGLAACSNSSGNGGGGASAQHLVNWEGVPANFHPQIQEITGEASGVTKVNVNLFGFTQDVQVVYEQRPDVAVRMYTVWNESGLLPSPSVVRRANTLRYSTSGGYDCSYDISNGQIRKLKGGCLMRIDIAVPVGAEVEVYNVDQLISARYFPIDNQTFLSDLDKAFPSQPKFAVINDYLKSYSDTKKIPILATTELAHIVHAFMMTEEKYQALSMLNRYVMNRSSLSGMIEQEFMYFDREKARQICGL